MPMNQKGRDIMSDFMAQYGKKKGKRVAYATANKSGEDSSLYSLFHKGGKK